MTFKASTRSETLPVTIAALRAKPSAASKLDDPQYTRATAPLRADQPRRLADLQRKIEAAEAQWLSWRSCARNWRAVAWLIHVVGKPQEAGALGDRAEPLRLHDG